MLSSHSKMISKQFLCDLAYGDVPINEEDSRQRLASASKRWYPTMELVPPTRIERATRGLGNRCSIQLSYGGVA
jgi:hypothetical protein